MGSVLILAGTRRVVITIARSLTALGHSVDIAVMASEEDRLLRSRAIRHRFDLPEWRQNLSGFEQALVRILTDHSYDMVIPSTDDALAVVCELYDQLSSHANLGCPRPQSIRKVLDKQTTTDAARKVGARVPLQWSLSEALRLAGTGDLEFPLVAKLRSKDAMNDSHVRYLHSAMELKAVIEEREIDQRFMLQEYCPGEGVGIEVLMHNGQAVALFQHRRLREMPPSGGVSVAAVAESVSPELARQAIALLKELDWEGVAMVEFRQDKSSGRSAVMEVNGRYWGSLPLSHLAGVDFPALEYRLRRANAISSVAPTYQPGIRMRWFVGDLRRLAMLARHLTVGRCGLSQFLKEFWTATIDTFTTPDALWSSSDPQPAWDDLIQFAIDIVRAAGRRLLPPSLRQPLWMARKYGLRAGYYFVRARLLRRFRANRSALSCITARPRSVLVLCRGNVIRSPIAEAFLLSHLRRMGANGISVSSAGLEATPGLSADSRAKLAALARGISLDHHRARLALPCMLDQSDMVIIMDEFNEAIFCSRFPSQAHKLILLARCREMAATPYIQDPDAGSQADVDNVCSILEACTASLARHFECLDQVPPN